MRFKVGDLVRYNIPQYKGGKPLGIVVKVWSHGNLKVELFMQNGMIWSTDQPQENFEKVEGDDESR